MKKLRQADAYALMADESSDQAHREHFAVLVKFEWQGKIEEHYINIIHVIHTDAASLMKAIEDFLNCKNVDIKKAMFVGFDGCNTMSGVNKGNLNNAFI